MNDIATVQSVVESLPTSHQVRLERLINRLAKLIEAPPDASDSVMVSIERLESLLDAYENIGHE